jgi:Uma2 family endonuclease
MMTTPGLSACIVPHVTLPTPRAEPSIMGMPRAVTSWTAAMLAELPDDGNRYEVVDGELLVTPAPAWPHQTMIGALYRRLAAWLEAHRVAHVMLAPADVTLDPKTLVQPDLFVVPLHAGRAPRSWAEAGELLLAVEVVSPASARADRHLKRRRYQRAGADEYWVVDLDARLVERWRPADERGEPLAERLVWRPRGAAEGLAIDLRELFAEALER